MPTAPHPAPLLPGLLVALMLLGAPSRARAQATPADSAAVVLETARTFEARDRWEVAEPLYRLILERWGGTPAAALARERLAAPPAAVVYGNGRVEAEVWTTLYGAWLGVAIPGALGADQPEAYGAGLLVGAPAGFLAGRGLASALQLTEGQARAVTLGGSWGTWQGYGWREVFELGTGEVCEPIPFDGGEFCYEPEDASEETFAAMVVGGLVGIAGGALLSGREISPGTGTAVNFGALWGSWLGMAGAVLFGLEEDDLLAATLIGGNAGLVSMALLAPRWRVSRNRARLVSIGGVLGGLAGGGLDLIVQPDDERAAVAIPLAGSLVGLTLGILATRGDPPASGGSADGGRDGALFGLRDGRLGLGTPVPLPALGPSRRGDRASWRPTLALEIFRATF